MPVITLNSATGVNPGGCYSPSCTAGGMVWISGQLPITPEGQRLNQAPFGEQVSQVLANLDACLAGAGINRQHLVSVRVYVTDIDRWPEFNRLYGAWIGDHRPARAVVGVNELHYGMMLEVEAVALAA